MPRMSFHNETYNATFYPDANERNLSNPNVATLRIGSVSWSSRWPGSLPDIHHSPYDIVRSAGNGGYTASYGQGHLSLTYTAGLYDNINDRGLTNPPFRVTLIFVSPYISLSDNGIPNLPSPDRWTIKEARLNDETYYNVPNAGWRLNVSAFTLDSNTTMPPASDFNPMREYKGPCKIWSASGNPPDILTFSPSLLFIYGAVCPGGPLLTAATVGSVSLRVTPPGPPSMVDPVTIPSTPRQSPRTLTAPAELLSEEAREVVGVAADGVARVVLRIPTATAGDAVDITICGDKPEPANCGLPLSEDEYGTLTTLDDLQVIATPRRMLSKIISRAVPGSSSYALAVYRGPADFMRRSPSTNTAPLRENAGLKLCPADYSRGDCQAVTRPVFLRITSTRRPEPYWLEVTIVRPLVALIHGLWGTKKDLRGFSTVIAADVRFRAKILHYDRFVTLAYKSRSAINPPYPDQPIVTINHPYSARYRDVQENALGVKYAAGVVSSQLARFINEFRTGDNQTSKAVAAIKADIIGHSMGGLVGRAIEQYPTESPGRVHKLITVGTPHRGSPLAGALLEDSNSCVRNTMASVGRTLSIRDAEVLIGGVVQHVRGAVADLINPDALFTVKLPMAMIAGKITRGQAADLPAGNFALLVRSCFGPPSPFAAYLEPVAYERFMGGDHDGIVPLSSASDGDLGRTIVVNALHSPGTRDLGFSGPSLLDTTFADEVLKLLLASSLDKRIYRYR